ncbi:MAG: dihydropteroate synthase [Bacteroidetes bacterium]|nr:dihydropteroate synthase [Bacteroidota bacterium]
MIYQPRNYSINCKGRLIDLRHAKVMGILNITPDSFFDGGKFTEENSILERVRQLVTDGAEIIDIGGASSRQGASLVTESEEEARLIPTIELLAKAFPNLLLSVDTWRSTLAEKAIQKGAHIINDISAGQFDDNMFETVARLQVPYIMMHLKGNVQTMHQKFEYSDLLVEVIQFFQERIIELRKMGIKDIIIDPGFGFSKAIADNFLLLKNLNTLQILDVPLVVGISRKSMINKTLNISAAEALNGTTALNTVGLMGGANILRVHDPKEASECIKLVQALTATS